IGNAVKFTDSGYIKLCAKKVSTKDNYIDLILAVEDSGIGIPDDQQTLIFESFKQQDGQSTRKYGGTGLGLAISKRLVEMMNGEIAITSIPGKGSRFEITLRAVKIAIAVSNTEPNNIFEQHNITFKKTKVLVVDDVESNRSLIEEYLLPVNLEVIFAENGQKALLFAEEYHPALILMDIRMPEMDGYEATKRLKNNPNTADIPVIALTASVALDKKVHNFNDYLFKPINISVLLDKLSQYIEYSMENIDTEIVLDSVDNITILQDKIAQEIIPLWEEANIGIEQEVIIKLAEKLIKLGNKHNVPIFINYGELLQEYIQSFDITNTLKLLKNLPEIIISLSKINNDN
ncbi:MAG: response regulator, partial [Proteobacteria bacterium]|nr:response regulator [Pseudomonadota bacterium]